jgi:hypothetical protein
MINMIHWPTLVPEDDVKAKAKKLADKFEQRATQYLDSDKEVDNGRFYAYTAAAVMVRETFGLKGE